MKRTAKSAMNAKEGTAKGAKNAKLGTAKTQERQEINRQDAKTAKTNRQEARSQERKARNVGTDP